MREMLSRYFIDQYGDEKAPWLKHIDRSLKEAQVWTARKLANTPSERWHDRGLLSVLRSPELMITPISAAGEITSTYWDFDHLSSWVNTRRSQQFTFEQVQRRRAGLPEEEDIEVPGLDSINPNRLLIYEPDMCLDEGACSPASNGYFDGEDCPPWDTWVTTLEVDRSIIVLSYIPEEFDADVDQGISASSTLCIYRATEFNPK